MKWYAPAPTFAANGTINTNAEARTIFDMAHDVVGVVSDAEVSKAHFEQLARLAGRLADGGIAVYSHRYDGLSFGSWVVEAGTRHRRVRVTYDGREGLLRFENAVVGSSASAIEWREGETLGVTPAAAWERAMEGIATSCQS